MLLLLGCMGFGLVLGWSGGFVGRRGRALAWRAGCAALVVITLAMIGWPAALAAFAGIAGGSIGHEAFANGVRAGRAA